MTPDLAREIFWIQLVHLISLAIVVRTNLAFFSRAGKDATLYRYIQLQICLALWIIAKVMKTISPTESLRWAWIVVQYAGVSALGPSFFHFAYRYAERKRPRGLWLLYAIGAAFFLAGATNPKHHLYYATYDFYGDTFGPLFYAHSAYTYGLVVTGIVIAARGFRKGRSVRMADAIIAASAAVPLAVNVLYILGFIQPLFDITPIMMSLSLGLFALAAFRHGFLGVLPFPPEAVIRRLPDPVVVRTPSGATAYSTLPDTDDGEYGRYRTVRKRGYSIDLYADFGRIRRLEREFDERNRALEALNERLRKQNARRDALYEVEAANQARMDLHDVLGHSVTLIILLLRAAASSLDYDTPKAHGLVVQAGGQAAAAAQGLEQAVRPRNKSGTEGPPPYEYLSRLLDGIVGQYQDTDLSVEISIRGQERAVAAPLARALERCCQESFANATKYSGARSIFVGAIFRPGSILLAVIDDGDGTDDFVPGHGIAMMRDRIAAFGGKLRISTARGEGFQLSVSVPA
jgi:signal transduction histidine kinase